MLIERRYVSQSPLSGSAGAAPTSGSCAELQGKGPSLSSDPNNLKDKKAMA